MADQLQHENSTGCDEAALPAEFIAVCVLAFIVSVAATAYFCRSMCCEMEMPGGVTMSTMWMRTPGHKLFAYVAGDDGRNDDAVCAADVFENKTRARLVVCDGNWILRRLAGRRRRDLCARSGVCGGCDAVGIV